MESLACHMDIRRHGREEIATSGSTQKEVWRGGAYLAMSWDVTVPLGAISWEKLCSWVGSPGLLLPEKSSLPANSYAPHVAVSRLIAPPIMRLAYA